ncbi:MAG: AhpC/TSA family protein [Acidobacteriota bacterium]
MKARRQTIEATGTRVAFIHMGSEAEARPFFARWGDAEIARFSDPEARLYREFGLRRMSIGEIFNLSNWLTVWKRGFEAAIIRRFGFGVPVGDPLRMPSAFLVHQGRIVREYRHQTPADRPDYESLAVCEIS